jgi:cytochrome c556
MKFAHLLFRKGPDGRADWSARTRSVAAMLTLLAMTTIAASAWQTMPAKGATPQASAATSQKPSDEAEGIIFERQQIMEKLDKDTDRLGSIVAGELPPDQLAATTRAIAQGAKDAVAAFEPNVPGGRSKAAVWSNRADYSQRLQSFAQKSEAMAKAGETGDVALVTSLMGDALPCKQCHDIYREKKKTEPAPGSVPGQPIT